MPLPRIAAPSTVENTDEEEVHPVFQFAQANPGPRSESRSASLPDVRRRQPESAILFHRNHVYKLGTGVKEEYITVLGLGFHPRGSFSLCGQCAGLTFLLLFLSFSCFCSS